MVDERNFMPVSEYVKITPWDTQIFGINTYEILDTSELVFDQILHQITTHNISGHYTVKIVPLASKKLLYKYGFYYCDTLLEPYCEHENLVEYQKEKITISKSIKIEQLLEICHGAFTHGRFHRDFNLEQNLADLRYDSWLKQLYEAKTVFGLMYAQDLAGFWGFSKNKIILHALAEKYRGRGLAKYFWSIACLELFNLGYSEITSSISASNIAVLSLYSSLGFKFRNAIDVYHLLIE